MRKLFKCVLFAVPVAGALALALAAAGSGIDAADHLNPPGRTNSSIDDTPDIPADIADVFAFVRGDQLILAMTFAGPNDADEPAFYDRDVLYKIFVSTQPPASSAEMEITWKFGPGEQPDQFGVRVEGLPGVAGGVIEGSVETTLQKDGVTVLSGLFDDPFFFDSTGLTETRATGDIRITNQRDFFAAQNDTAIIISIPIERFDGATLPIDVWGQTLRFGGNI